MKAFFPKSLVLVLLYCLLLTSCNGGGGSLTAGGGIDGTGIMSAGVVSAFGSIVVNGREFDTSKAAIVINGEKVGVGDDAVLENLDIGRVVTVEGRISKDGTRVTADRVVYSNNVTGPVESVSGIDPITNEKEIVVLGQIVVVNFITKFKPDTFVFDSIAANDVVEVSGYLDDTGAIRATFIEKTGDVTTILDYEVTGFVENLDTDFKTFIINGLKVDYSSIANNLPQGIPADDLYVEVEGKLAAGGEMLATKIELGDKLDGEDGDEFEILGFVTDVVSAFEFTVGNQVVIADANTVLVDEPPGGIQLGVKLEAEGRLVDGIFLADEIEFWKPDQIEVEGVVTQVLSKNEFAFGNQMVQTNDETVFEPSDLEIREGIRLEVKGVPQDIDHSVLVADKVSFETD